MRHDRADIQLQITLCSSLGHTDIEPSPDTVEIVTAGLKTSSSCKVIGMVFNTKGVILLRAAAKMRAHKVSQVKWEGVMLVGIILVSQAVRNEYGGIEKRQNQS